MSIMKQDQDPDTDPDDLTTSQLLTKPADDDMLPCMQPNRKEKSTTHQMQKLSEVLPQNMLGNPILSKIPSIKKDNDWKCKNCSSISPNLDCYICSRTDRRKVILQCNTCKKIVHRICHDRKHTNYKCKEIEWNCYDCDLDTLACNIDIDSNRTNHVILPKGIRIGHINVRDLLAKNKLDEIKIILKDYDFDVLAISETWLWKDIDTSEIDITEYNTYRMDRSNIKSHNTRGGGVVIYVKSIYNIEQIANPFSLSDKVQAVKIKISKMFMKPITIIAIYRVSTTPGKFLNELSQEISRNSTEEFVILGDLNIDQLITNNEL